MKKQSMKLPINYILILVSTIVLSLACETVPYTKLVWSDEFDGDLVDQNKWTFEIGNGDPALPGWGNNECQFYQSINATIQDLPEGGRGLVIEARLENEDIQHRYNSCPNTKITSARIKTEGLASWTYGRFEARMKLPEGQGIWPAFWMLGENIKEVGWPASGEIDIMELVGHQPDIVHGTLHFGNPHQFDGESYILPGIEKFSDTFHVFALEWEEDELRWYVDDNLYYSRSSWYSSLGDFPAPFDRDFFLLINLAVGGNWPGYPDNSTNFPQKLYVDYVRVYSKY